MAVLIWIFFGSDPSKMDQTWSNLIKLDQIGFPRQSKNVTIKSCHIFKKNKNGCFVFDFFGSDPSKMDQTWSNLIKLDFLANLKMSLWKVVTFPERIKMAILFLIFWIRSVQNGSNMIKLDQIGFSHQSKNVTGCLIAKWTK